MKKDNCYGNFQLSLNQKKKLNLFCLRLYEYKKLKILSFWKHFFEQFYINQKIVILLTV